MATGTARISGSAQWGRTVVLGVAVGVALAAAAGTPATAAEIPESGDSVWVGAAAGYSGTAMHAVYLVPPADPGNPGEPDFWAYCVEQPVTAHGDATAYLGDISTFLGANYFTDPGILGKVLWVLAHSYPALSLDEFGQAAGVPGISQADAVEAAQYAIWRYTDLGFDAAWPWETDDSRDAYLYLVGGADPSSGLDPADFVSTVAVTAPTQSQTAGSLVGPFVVTTNQPRASVSVDPPFAVVAADGTAIDTDTVVDGQELYLDLRGSNGAGSATVTASVRGSSATGLVLSMPDVDGQTPVDSDHWQSRILVTAAGTTTDARASAEWAQLAGATSSQQLAASGSQAAAGALAVGAALLVLGAIVIVARRRSAA